MASKHTRGPWHLGAGNGEGSIFGPDCRMRLEAGGTTLYPVCVVVTGWDQTEDEANARLIAAAPEMLESLKDLENILSGKPYDRDEQRLLQQARDAIARATGK